MNTAIFKTREGKVVLKSHSRYSCYSANRAIEKARAKGYTSLLAYEPAREEPIDYTLMLTRNLQGAT